MNKTADLHLLTKLCTDVTSQAGVSAYKTIQTLHNTELSAPISKEIHEAWKVIIDQAATDAMTEALSSQKDFHVQSIWSEGAKEALKVGKAAPSVVGEFGPKDGIAIDKASDPVEGTTQAAKNGNCVSSVIAVNTRGGIMAHKSNAHYMEKLFAPGKVKGKISLTDSVEGILETIKDAYGLKPHEIHVVILERLRNQRYICGAKKFGATLKLLQAGDLIPAVLATLDPNTNDKGVHVMLGSGGTEEGVMAAVAAKAVGGMAQGRFFDENAEKLSQNPILTLDDLVPGSKETSVFSATIVNNDPWFGIEGIHKNHVAYHSNTLVVNRDGWRIEKKNVEYKL